MSEHITVTARRPHFRRAGRAWSAEATTVPAADFTADELAALRAEPNLVVVDAPAPPPPPEQAAEERAARLARAAAALDELADPIPERRVADVLGVLAALDGGPPLRDVTADEAQTATSHHWGDDPEGGSETASGDPVQEGDDPAAGPDPDAGDPDRHALIVAAMDRLDPGQSNHWTGTGKPRLDVLHLAGAPEDLTAEERDRIWADVRP